MDDISRDHPADAGSAQPGDGRDRRAEAAAVRRARAVLDGGADGPAGDSADGPGGDAGIPAEGISAADAAAALAAAEDAIEIDEVTAGEAEDGLPPVPELADVDAVARVVFVLLLSQREGLSLLRLAQATNATQKLVDEALPRLQQWLRDAGLPVELARTGDVVKFLSDPSAFPYLQRLRGVKKLEKLSPAALETLAVIAYRQPVMRAEIEAIRGVKAGPMLRTLLSHKLVRVTGRADVPGRPLQYGTTQQFLERFGLTSLAELPSVKEWKQLG
jgi:segregation and condensation protein B